MTAIAIIAANSWSITIGGGWIVLMFVGMGLCFVFMLGFMALMHDGRGWAMCHRWSRQTTPPTDVLTGVPPQKPDRTVSPESEARRQSDGYARR
jgi:hypothetical protein